MCTSTIFMTVQCWINKSGLTKAEAARVQPQYGPCGGLNIVTLNPLEVGKYTRLVEDYENWVCIKQVIDLPIINIELPVTGAQATLQTLETLPLLIGLIVGSIGFIALEWLSYKGYSLFALTSNGTRGGRLLYATAVNLFMGVAIGSLAWLLYQVLL